MSESEETVIPRLIEKATNSTAGEVDPRLLTSIKSTARSSDFEIRASVHALMSQMKKPHSQVRYLSLLIVDELFMRSKLFRSLFVLDLDHFLSLSIGFRRNLPLPPPSSVASTLRSKSIELLEKWNASFGIHYRQLRLGFDYLKNTLRFQFPNQFENAARVQQERREREIRSKEILLTKFENLKENYSSIKNEIQSTVDEIGECLEIIKDDQDLAMVANVCEEEVEEFESLTLRQIRMDALKEGEKVQENIENKAVFDALREFYKLLVSKHLPLVQEWISVLIRVDVSDNRFRDSALKEMIDLRNLVHSVKKRCAELGSSIEKDEEDDLWEEGKIEVPSVSNNGEKGSADTPSSSKGKDVIDSTQKGSSSLTPEKSKLLAEAPVMTWSACLDDWGSTRDALANQRGLELDGHWGRVDPDAVIPAQKIAELKLHCMLYKEEASEIRPCLAPLKKGGFCQRRDLKVCPFHGPIIPRDAEGKPTKCETQTEGDNERENANDSADSAGSFEIEKEVFEKLAKQAVKNVRERDREETDVKKLKRAKLAKVRQHNEAVLRQAAVASTSYSESIRENGDDLVQGGTDMKKKKATLASMLRKKETTKNRLAKRLLNIRVTDASSRQVTQGEDSKYREAFPNQW